MIDISIIRVLIQASRMTNLSFYFYFHFDNKQFEEWIIFFIIKALTLLKSHNLQVTSCPLIPAMLNNRSSSSTLIFHLSKLVGLTSSTMLEDSNSPPDVRNWSIAWRSLPWEIGSIILLNMWYIRPTSNILQYSMNCLRRNEIWQRRDTICITCSSLRWVLSLYRVERSTIDSHVSFVRANIDC